MSINNGQRQKFHWENDFERIGDGSLGQQFNIPRSLPSTVTTAFSAYHNNEADEILHIQCVLQDTIPCWYDDKWPCQTSTAWLLFNTRITSETRHQKPKSPVGSDSTEWQPFSLHCCCSFSIQLRFLMHAVRNVHSVCQWGILSIVDPRCKKALCNRAVFHCVWSWQANIKQTLRRWVVLHLSSLSRSVFHFLSSFILSVPFSFLVPFLHTLVPKPLNAPCCFETLVKKNNTSIIVSVSWPEHPFLRRENTILLGTTLNHITESLRACPGLTYIRTAAHTLIHLPAAVPGNPHHYATANLHFTGFS